MEINIICSIHFHKILSEEGISKLTFNLRVTPDANYLSSEELVKIMVEIFHLISEERNHYCIHLGNLLKVMKVITDCGNNNPGVYLQQKFIRMFIAIEFKFM